MTRWCIFFLIGFLTSFVAAGAFAKDYVLGENRPEHESNVSTILPGFQPIKRFGDSLELYARTYTWDNSFFPANITSRSKTILSALQLHVRENGISRVLTPSQVSWTESPGNRLNYFARSASDGLSADVELSVDYDGVIDVNLTLTPTPNNSIEKVYLTASIPRNRYTTILGFAAKTIRLQKRRNDVLKLPYRGELLNAISIGDGERSLWWFADSRRGWIGQPSESLKLIDNKGHISFVATIVSVSRGKFVAPTTIRFGLLGAPVKKVVAADRRNRISIGSPSKKEQALGGKYKLWWPTAFAYDAYPYVTYQDHDARRLTEDDLGSYPGLENNRELVRKDRSAYDLEWVPYFSAHVLSELDPSLQRNREAWEVDPPKIFRDGLSPYSNKFSKPVLSHNAPGYSDYLVGRLAKATSQLGVHNIYLDHGPPIDSMSPSSGGWRDTSGSWQPAMDIFAMRDFLKKLTVGLISDSRDGGAFVHSSNRELLPALTFARGIVDGEQYRSDVIDGRYLDIVPLNEFRARFSTAQSGVATYWLPGDWYVNRNDRSWNGSQRQLIAFRRVMGLALAHDVPIWPQGASIKERERLLNLLDRIGISKAEFVGYWNEKSFVEIDELALPTSLYVTKTHVLAVVLNDTNQEIMASFAPSNLIQECATANLNAKLSDRINADFNLRKVRIPAQDFALLTYSVSDLCRAGLLE